MVYASFGEKSVSQFWMSAMPLTSFGFRFYEFSSKYSLNRVLVYIGIFTS